MNVNPQFPKQRFGPRKPQKKQLCPAMHQMEYTAEELEFMRAVDAYKQAKGRQFPTLKEIFDIVRSLGYVKR